MIEIKIIMIKSIHTSSLAASSSTVDGLDNDVPIDGVIIDLSITYIK
jgi:hypothetical protein